MSPSLPGTQESPAIQGFPQLHRRAAPVPGPLIVGLVLRPGKPEWEEIVSLLRVGPECYLFPKTKLGACHGWSIVLSQGFHGQARLLQGSWRTQETKSHKDGHPPGERSCVLETECQRWGAPTSHLVAERFSFPQVTEHWNVTFNSPPLWDQAQLCQMLRMCAQVTAWWPGCHGAM